MIIKHRSQHTYESVIYHNQAPETVKEKCKIRYYTYLNPKPIVTNYYFIVNLSPWLAVRACSLSSPGGDSSYSWVLVHALGHNLGRE